MSQEYNLRFFPLRANVVEVMCAGIVRDANWAINRTRSDWHVPIAEFMRSHYGHRAPRVFMPTPSTMNGVVVRKEDFTQHHAYGNILISNGIDADGVLLDSGTAFAVTSGDCPTLVLFNQERVLGTHVGLRSVVQPDASSGSWGQQHNVVKNALTAIGGSPKEVQAFICCGIRTGYQFSTRHPEFGKRNASLHSWIRERHPRCHRAVLHPERETIDMIALVRAELMELGVPRDNIQHDNIDTFANVSPDGEYLWASNARSARQTPPGPKQRNLVVVASL